MSNEGHNRPDDLWRKAFDEATETPPPRVWDAIERRLDESDGAGVLPLWGTGLASSRPFIWGVGLAAAVALLLVGWWVIRTESGKQPVAQTQPVVRSEDVATTPSTASAPAATNRTARRANPTEAIASAAQQTSPVRQPAASHPGQPFKPSPRQPANEPLIQTLPQPTLTPDYADVSSSAALPENASMTNTSRVTTAAFTPTARLNEPADAVAQLTPFVLEPLAGQPVRLREPRPIQRIVWFHPAEPLVEPASVERKRSGRELWASVSVMPGAFNPSVSVQSPSARNAYTMNSVVASSPTVNSRADFSVAYQASAGVQLTERWSVESGVGYLAGRSTVDSPAEAASLSFQAANVNRRSSASNLYVDALRNSSHSGTAVNVAKANTDLFIANAFYAVQTTYDARSRQTVTNDYQYVQVPVQVGYQLRPRKRLNLALLGGLLTNIFVRNTVGDELVLTTKDGVYRPLSWAATMGARFRYRPSRRWSASLAGVYQPSLGLGTQASSQVQSRPTATGMSFGVDYHF